VFFLSTALYPGNMAGMVKVEGTLELTNLPPHRGLIVSLCFYRVRGPEAPPPHKGDPPAEAATDVQKLIADVHLEQESRDSSLEQTFSIKHAPGFYYVQVRAILFRVEGGKTFAQAEQFFFARRPLHLTAEMEGRVVFPVAWPAKPLQDLQSYGTISPKDS